ncbi:conserved hypothetical protein [Mucor ambiguus]|uniref:MSP domain-containing protein n=1 Tax=Mucor ambiguus TaxID=91626 RepID=A0A0C9N0T4_9FUNG|nr:conserved hypothetical protein [Mucor ambiguus]
MSVIIEPSDQLEFHRPFTRVVKESIYVKNPGTEPVIFKVKTTAPKQYCVRPNAGRIEPNSEIEVQIILQPFKDELPEDFKCKDKFLVQTAPVTAVFEQNDITSMWSHVETNERASMHQHKLRCAFVGPREETREMNEATQASIPEPVTTADGIASSTVIHSEPSQQQPPAIPSHHHDHTTEEPLKENIASAVNAPAPIVAAAVAAGAVATPTASSREISNEASAPISPTVPSHTTIAAPVVETAAPAPVSLNTASITEPMTPSSASAVTTTHPATSSSTINTATPVPVSRADNTNKEKELKEALEKIAYLEKQLNDLRKEEGLRARTQTGTSSRKLASTVQPLDAVHQHLAALEEPRPTEGYPPQVVLGVAIFAFLFAYLFF